MAIHPTDNRTSLPPLPQSWSELTWQQLCQCWEVKIRYPGDHDAARAAAFLALCGCSVCRNGVATLNLLTGEALFLLRSADGQRWTTTPRELSYLAQKALAWFDFPYGDPGEEEERDEKGNVIKGRREAIPGYVNHDTQNWRDAMAPPVETVKVGHRHFALPQVGGHNLTWQQYRSLQGIASQLFQEGITEAQILTLQAQFLAHSLVPRSLALFDTNGGSIRLHPHWEYIYSPTRADGMAEWWEKRMKHEETLYHICFQTYHTAVRFYEAVYPLLFQDSGKHDPLHTALTGEGDTITAIMEEGHFTSPQEVYDANLPFILSVLNRMAKKAKEIEKMNSKIKK